MRANKALETALAAFVSERGWQWPDKTTVEPPKDKRFGDLATNLAMVLAPQAKANPRATAEDIAAHLRAACPDLAAVDIAGPAFINATFTPAFWQKTAAEAIEAGAAYGRLDAGAGKKVMVEYVSANPTGPLHIGHGRGAAVGDSLARILRAAGYDARTEYYLNDAGRQMRLLGTSVWVRAQQALGRDAELPEDCYKGDYIKDVAKIALERGGDALPAMDEAAAVDFCRQVAQDEILAGIKKDLEDFRCEHQVWFSEKSLLEAGKVEETFELLRSQGRAYDKDGAFWFRSTDFGDDKDRVLRKSDGSLTYFASDIAYHDDKYRRGFDLVVDIWGADHHGYVPRMSAAVQALGREAGDLRVILVQLVNLLQGGEQIAMSTRAGKFETLADVCAEVGADAARFTFLSRKSDSHLDFDLELVKQRSMDNPVYYVQYAHARINSVFRKAADEGVDAGRPDAATLARLDTEADLDLLRHLERYPDCVATAAESMSPHHVSYYLTELAGLLHRYYTVNQVLAAPDADTVRARLHLLAATAQVIRNGLDLLGVDAPEAM